MAEGQQINLDQFIERVILHADEIYAEALVGFALDASRHGAPHEQFVRYILVAAGVRAFQNPPAEQWVTEDARLRELLAGVDLGDGEEGE